MLPVPSALLSNAETLRGVVVVEEQAEFEEWLADFPTYSEVLARPAPSVAAGQAAYAVCAACHGAAAEGNKLLNAPRLAGLEGWYLERQIRNFQHGIRGADASDPFGMQMAPMAATLADDTAMRNAIAFITSLPEARAEPTIEGDVERGRKIYTTCGSCHGTDGAGIWSQKAPALRGTDDWYLVRQLENYRQGIRGSHPQDLYGKQMNLMQCPVRPPIQFVPEIADNVERR